MTGLTEELGETMVRYAASYAAASCLFGQTYGHTENLSEIPSFSPTEEGDSFGYTQTSCLTYDWLNSVLRRWNHAARWGNEITSAPLRSPSR